MRSLVKKSVSSPFSFSTAFPATIRCTAVPPSPNITPPSSASIRLFQIPAGPSMANVSNSPPSPRIAPFSSPPNLLILLANRATVFRSATFIHRHLSSKPPLATLMIRASIPTAAMSARSCADRGYPLSDSERPDGGGRVGYCQRYASGTRPSLKATDSTRVRW